MKLFIPNQKISNKVLTTIVAGQLLFIGLLWAFSSSTLLPKPSEIGWAIYDMIAHKGILREFMSSLTLCLKAILFATLFAMLISYLSTIPFFSWMCGMTRKLRFLTTVGLSFLFMKMTPDVDSQKMALLIFGIYAFLVDSVMTIVQSTTTAELNYARTLKLNEFQVLWEVVIIGKLSQVFEAVRQNFAIAWMMLATVENLCKSQGGIGVALSDLNKWFKFEYVYGIQFLILFTGLGMDFLLTKLKGWFFPYTLLNLRK